MITQEQWDDVKSQFAGDDAEAVIEALDEYSIDHINDVLENGAGADIFHEIVDGNVDIYYSGLLKWLNDDDRSIEFVEDAVAGGYVDLNDFDFWKLISSGQYLQIQEEYSQGIYEINEYLD
jgi:hypothetical protein